MGTLGSGNHYLEVQYVSEVFDVRIAEACGLEAGDAVISIHCGSRGLGHQIGTEYLREMVIGAADFGIKLPDRELACAPINSELGQRYLGAMRAAVNCALANRCKCEKHAVNGEIRDVHVHRKGATRALGPGSKGLPGSFKDVGQPVFIGGSMGTSSYVLAGTEEGEALSYSSACHGAGRAMSRNKARKQWRGRQVVDELADQGILIRSPSFRGVAEEAPGAYKDVSSVVSLADRSGLARTVCRLRPMICVKG
jgi:tRNA-splicing ligase RtcB